MSERMELGGGWYFEQAPDREDTMFLRGKDAWGWVWKKADVLAFLAAMRPQVNVEAWRPIDSAPKDGTKIDLLYPYPRGRTINCFWKGEDGFGWVWREPRWRDGTVLSEIEWDLGCYPSMQPTHWMPLPSAPGTTPAPPPQTSGSVPNEIARATDNLVYLCKRHTTSDDEERDAAVCATEDAARAHLDALILAYVAANERLEHIIRCREDQLTQEIAASRRLAEALLDKPPPSAAVIPEGWRMVPATLTSKMCTAGWTDSDDVTSGDIYQALLAASPTPPAITLADIVALLTSERVEDEALAAFVAGGGSFRSFVQTALRVAAEAVLKLGAKP